MSVTIALAGNPNCGKTTLFNDLTGSNQYVGNWPGVTVEKKSGHVRGNKELRVMDLPGIYSLSPYSPEEVVSRDYLLNGEAGAILNLVDGTNLERNLYLTTQILEVGLPVVLALNMIDLVKKNGDKINTKKLSDMLGCEVIETSALRGANAVEAATAAASAAKNPKPYRYTLQYAPAIEAALSAIMAAVGNVPAGRERWYAIKLFERDTLAQQELALTQAQKQAIDAIIAPVENEFDDDAESIITTQRYEQIATIIAACVKKASKGLTTSDKIDRIVTNRWLALPIFAAIMFLVYYISVSTVGGIVTDWTNDTLFGEMIGENVAGLLEGVGAADWLNSLVVDGIIGGVGAVIGFVPQMIILFVFLSFLEDCGYMARIAFIMDRIFKKFGLSGKSFIPMLISSGCGVPGIMATKTIENEKDRRMTIITTTFIPCGAKLPIIALLAGALLGNEETWWIAPVMYFVGVAAVIVSGIILKKTKMFEGDPAPFVMELPQYHWPAPRSLFMHVWERVRSFIVKAGTIIFISSIVIWFLLGFGFENGGFGMVEEISNSILARIGSFVAPVFAPLGFGNWESTVAAIAGLVAKENLVSTLGIISGMSAEAADELLDGTSPLWAYVNTILPSVPAVLSFLAFNILCAPCFAAIGAISRQMASFKWTVFAVAYQTLFAYAIALIIFQLGTLFIGGGFGIGTVFGIVVLVALLFLLLRPAKKKNKLATA